MSYLDDDDDDELALLLPVDSQSKKKRHDKVAPCLNLCTSCLVESLYVYSYCESFFTLRKLNNALSFEEW